MAMYRARRAAAVGTCIHRMRRQELLASRAKWRERISQALIDDAFELHFQPIFDIRQHKVTCYETLVRMRDNAGQLVFRTTSSRWPEQSGQIHEIDRW